MLLGVSPQYDGVAIPLADAAAVAEAASVTHANTTANVHMMEDDGAELIGCWFMRHVGKFLKHCGVYTTHM